MLLIAGLATRLAAVLSSTLLVVFLVGIVSAAARGLQIECGCFGGGGQLGAGQSTAYTGEILRDAGLLVVSLFLIWAYRTRFAVDNLIRSYGPQPTVRGPRKTAEARRRLAALLEQRRQQGERRVRFASAATALVLVALVGIGIGVQASRIPAPTGPVPAGVSLADGVTVGGRPPRSPSTCTRTRSARCAPSSSRRSGRRSPAGSRAARSRCTTT